MLRRPSHMYINQHTQLNKTVQFWCAYLNLFFSSKFKFLCHALTLFQLLLRLQSAKNVLLFLFSFPPRPPPAFCLASYSHCLFSVFLFCRLSSSSYSKKSERQKAYRDGKNHRLWARQLPGLLQRIHQWCCQSKSCRLEWLYLLSESNWPALGGLWAPQLYRTVNGIWGGRSWLCWLADEW